jgi:hypothetical protein
MFQRICGAAALLVIPFSASAGTNSADVLKRPHCIHVK